MSEIFPGPDGFSSAPTRRPHDADDGAQSTFDGSIVVTMLERLLVEKALPVGLELALPRAKTTRHPVIHVVGHQREPRELRNGRPQPIPGARDYQELMLLVPFVQHSPVSTLHTYVVRMYLDDLRPVAIGNLVYAYAKERAQLAETEDIGAGQTTTCVKSLIGTEYFHSEVRRTGPWVSAGSTTATPPRWADIQAIFELPILGADNSILGTPVRFVCSFFEWDYTNAEVAPAVSRHCFQHPFRGPMHEWVEQGPLESAADGAVTVRGLRWRLALPPQPCSFHNSPPIAGQLPPGA